jgi:hypothetical protein
MICPVRRHHRQEAAVALADQVADLVVAVRRNFRESSRAPDHDSRRSASAAEEVYSVEILVHLTLPLVADQSAGRAQGVRIVRVAEVVGRPGPGGGQGIQVAAHPNVARPVAAMARRIAAREDAEPRELACLEPPPEQESLAQRQRELQRELVQQASPQQAQEWLRKAGPLVPRLLVQEQVSELQPEERAQLEQPVRLASERPPRAAELREQPPVLRALARLEQPGAVEPLWPLHLSHPCPPWLSPRRPLPHPRRPEGACEPSRQHPPESSWSASSFLVRRTRATGR